MQRHCSSTESVRLLHSAGCWCRFSSKFCCQLLPWSLATRGFTNHRGSQRETMSLFKLRSAPFVSIHLVRVSMRDSILWITGSWAEPFKVWLPLLQEHDPAPPRTSSRRQNYVSPPIDLYISGYGG